MGCDIHSYVEVKQEDKWKPCVKDIFSLDEIEIKVHFDIYKEKKTHSSHPFDWRSYGMFGFLADVRNYSQVPVIAEAKYDIPDDASKEIKELWRENQDDCHTATWLTLKQLLDFDYDQIFWDRRVTKQVAVNVWDGAATAEEGEGTHPTIREFLGKRFFEDLEVLKTLGSPENVRIVFWFDN